MEAPTSRKGLVTVLNSFYKCTQYFPNAIPQGQAIEGTSRIKKECSPTAIDWHPTKKVLAIGWETGDIQLWNDIEKNLYEPQSDHCSQIKSLNWTGNGTRLLSADSVRD